MIDMIFLLLIFFLVVSKWRPEENFLPFQLPIASAGNTNMGKPEPLIIYISTLASIHQVRIGQQEAVEIGGQNTESALADVMETMRTCMLSQKRFVTDPIEIVCSPEVKWEYLAKIYNVFFGAGFTDITFVMTEQPENEPFN
jgi:biopolymer transport protein ExbD